MRFLCVLVPLALAAAPAFAGASQRPVQVMVIGTFHWSNPNRDLHDPSIDDVRAPKRQKEIAELAKALSRFHPAQIAVEWPADLVHERYAKYMNGTLRPSRNEVVQLGFRLAKANGAGVHGVDADGDFPYEAVERYAKAHGQADILAEADSAIVHEVKQEQYQIDHGTISAARAGSMPPRAKTRKTPSTGR